MASHRLIIERAKVSAVLLRPDPAPVGRDQLTSFLGLLDNTLIKCTPANVQKCKEWLLQHVVHSPNRIGTLGKYFVALSRGSSESSSKSERPEAVPVTPRRKQLHLLYILNDLLHHVRYHGHDQAVASALSSSLYPFLVELVELIANAAKEEVRHRTEGLLKIWEEEGFFDKAQETALRSALSSTSTNAPKSALGEDRTLPSQLLGAREEAYILPSTHGDVSAAYHDLPAANLLPHIIPNQSIPIRPGDVIPLKLSAGPADASLITVVKDFMAAARALNTEEMLSKPDAELAEDIDELGQPMQRDETGDLLHGRSYYGWSREFCESIQARRTGKSTGRFNRRDSFGSSRSGSRSRSTHKRMRYDSDGDRSSSRSRSRSSHRDGRSRSRSRLSPARKQPALPPDARFDGPGWPHNIPPPPPKGPSATTNFGPPPIHQGFPPPFLGPGGVMIPPPPPPNYSGPWPPGPGNFNSVPQHSQAPYLGSSGGPVQFPYPGGRDGHDASRSMPGGWNR